MPTERRKPPPEDPESGLFRGWPHTLFVSPDVVLNLKREKRRLAIKALGWKILDKLGDAWRLWVILFGTLAVAFLALLPYLFILRWLGFL